LSGVLENRVVPMSLAKPQAADGAVSSVRAVLGRYQLVFDRLDADGALLWMHAGRRLRWPAPRALTRTFVTYQVRARVNVLRRRSRAHAALMKDAGPAETDLKILDLFAESLPATPSARRVTLGAAFGILLAAFILAKLVIGAHSARLLGDLTEAALKLDRSGAIDAVQRDGLKPIYFVGGAVILLWSLVLVALPLAPASSLARQLLRQQPGLREAEARAFAELRAPRPADPNLVAMIEWLLVIPMFVFSLAALWQGVTEPGSVVTGVVIAAVLSTTAVAVIGSLRHRDEHASARTRPQRVARRVTFTGYVLLLILASVF
jgi:hypothetical protein